MKITDLVVELKKPGNLCNKLGMFNLNNNEATQIE